MKIEKRNNKYVYLNGNKTIEMPEALPRVNHILNNYNNLLSQRNLAETQLAVANDNIEILLAELRKLDRTSYPQ